MRSIREQAREAEKVNNWAEAVRLWNIAGSGADAAACQMIIDSTARGDQYRARIEGKSPEEAHAIYIEMFLPHLLNK